MRSIAFAMLPFVVVCGGTSPPADSSAADSIDAADAVEVSPLADANDAIDAAATSPGLRGVFVWVSNTGPWTATAAQQGLAIADVDGLAIDLPWTAIAATAPRTYDFTALDALMTIARTAGKRVQLGIVIGDGVPSAWFDAATLMHLQYAPQGGRLGRCFDYQTPPLWDAAFLAAFDDMTAQLAAHIHAAGFDDTVVGVRLTGINIATAETHLPVQVPGTSPNLPPCLTVDNIAAWSAAGYRPSLLQSAWTSMVQSWSTHFAHVDFPLVHIDGQQFPPIDESGNTIAPSARAAADRMLHEALVTTASNTVGSHLVLEEFFLLTGTPADAVNVSDANTFGTPTGWQTNLWWSAYRNMGGTTAPGSAACGGMLTAAVQCTDATYLDLLNEGIQPMGITIPPAQRTRVVEVFMPDPTLYPVAVHTAHLELTQ